MTPLRIFFILFFVFLQFTLNYEFYNYAVGGAYLNGSLPSILLIGLCLAAANFYMAVELCVKARTTSGIEHKLQVFSKRKLG